MDIKLDFILTLGSTGIFDDLENRTTSGTRVIVISLIFEDIFWCGRNLFSSKRYRDNTF